MSLLSNLGKELGSWFAPSKVEVSDVPEVNSKAPSSAKLSLPRADGKATVITFLRHCGCPFAEKTMLQMRKLASTHKDVHFVAVSHSDQASTDTWAESVGGTGDVELIVDFERQIYGAWGLGVVGFWHVLNSSTMGKLGKLKEEEGISNRWTQSGSRWQSSGTFAVDGSGTVKWSKPAVDASDVPDLEEAVKAATT